MLKGLQGAGHPNFSVKNVELNVVMMICLTEDEGALDAMVCISGLRLLSDIRGNLGIVG